MSKVDRVLVFCEATAMEKNRSGIHNVTINLVRALSDIVPTSLVCWNEIEGQLRFMDYCETLALFRDGIPERIQPPLQARSVKKRFDDLVFEENVHFLFPEISYHLNNGNDILARIVSQCREYGFPVSGIYYDAIPVTNRHYHEFRRLHIDYLVELCRFDRIFPISQFSSDSLMEIFQNVDDDDGDMERFKRRLKPVLLPEGQYKPRTSTHVRDGILMVGTVEPRKQQLEVLQVLSALRDKSPKIASMRVDVVGSIHPAVFDQVQKEIERNPLFKYHGFISDLELEDLYDRAAFSVFASYDEGYGLPISESLVRGVPCLTANFGSMAEVARNGGCLTVNVKDTDDLKIGLQRMAEDIMLLSDLKEQIRVRPFRNWQHYAHDVLDGMASASAALPKHSTARLPTHLAFAVLPIDDLHQTEVGSLKWMDRPPVYGFAKSNVVAAVLTASDKDIGCLSRADFDALCNADVLGVTNEAILKEVYDRARKHELPSLLPTRVVIEACTNDLLNATHHSLCEALQSKTRRLKIACEERIYGKLRRHFAREGEIGKPILSLVISTYNRSAFVKANASWLADQIKRFNGKVNLTIVDNASTDDSWIELQNLHKLPNVSLIQNPSNVGMLGNLHVCSTLPLARHVWVTGDDDFITAEALEAVVNHLEDNPGLALGFVNFAVYHRQALSPYDTPSLLQSEGILLGKSPAPDGMRRVCEIAAEHDNLFTAVYPIIFRSDVLAACFNYPFQGVPFGDLVESVPTTKIILESYAHCDAYWFSGVGTVGNAYNSWSRHRPRWHALLMPQVFELAREAGVDQQKLRIWADAHFELFDDAIAVARTNNMAVHFDGDADLQPGYRVFLKPVVVPDDLRRWENPAFSKWDGR